jgi:hypothetical protein
MFNDAVEALLPACRFAGSYFTNPEAAFFIPAAAILFRRAIWLAGLAIFV